LVNKQKIPIGRQVKVLDIGTGANLIYPILGNACYGWGFVGAEIEPKAISAAQAIVAQNQTLQSTVEIRKQQNSSWIFHGIIHSEEVFDLTLCNPPFHESAEAAATGSLRKIKNLTGSRKPNPVLNFGGQSSELWCEGGESAFITQMIQESIDFKFNCFWFTTLVAKETSLPRIYAQLKKSGVTDFKTISMAQGNKVSRLVAWTFLQPKQVQNWQKLRWNRKS
jgi:23S rRNA (adenine1618-N6)-methyltransferase